MVGAGKKIKPGKDNAEDDDDDENENENENEDINEPGS